MFPMNDQFAGFFKNFQPSNEQFTAAFKNFIPANGQFPGIASNVFAANEELTGTFKAAVEAQLAYAMSLSTTALDTASKVADLNMNAVKASVDESTVIAKQLVASTNTQEALELLAALPQPTVTKAVAYGRHLSDIAKTAQTEFSRATQEQFAEATRKATAIVDGAAKNAPAGSENAVALMKTAIANANAGYEQLTTTTRQAAEAVQANVAASVDQATQVVEQVATATSRKGK